MERVRVVASHDPHRASQSTVDHGVVQGAEGATIAASQEAKDRFRGKAGDQVRAALGDCHLARVTPGIILHGPPHDLLRNFQGPHFIEVNLFNPGHFGLGRG